MSMAPTHPQRGFTLVEMIIVIVITGIIAGIVAIFIKAPVQGYVDSARRAELTDIADTALRRMARDIRIAVPNSFVQPANCGATPCFQIIVTRDGARYRGDPPGNQLQFNGSDTNFEALFGAAAFTLTAGERIVIGSSQSDGSIAYSTAASGGLRTVASYNAGPHLVTLNQGLQPELEMPTRRFDVVDGTQNAVLYACENLGVDANGTGTGVLRRYSNYWGTPSANPVFPPGGTSAILADKVSGCTIEYDLPNQRFGLAGIRLTLSSSNESVTLYHEVHVNNVP